MNPILQYIEPVFRPPSEANSLILQVTNGCSWNNCTFCEMYTAPQKKFSAKNQQEISAEIEKAVKAQTDVRRIFLADGDAMVLSTRRLLTIIEEIKQHFPRINRISTYCLPRNVKNKSINELAELKSAGLTLVYIGAESGDDQLLKLVNKGETNKSTIASANKLHAAEIKTSVMILNGLGGDLYSEQHAIHTAQLVNEIQPNYLATLVVSFPMGKARFLKNFPKNIKLLEQDALFREMEIFIQHTSLENSIFRSDHASNYLVLKGILGKDKQKILEKLYLARTSPDQISLREEWQRGL